MAKLNQRRLYIVDICFRRISVVLLRDYQFIFLSSYLIVASPILDGT